MFYKMMAREALWEQTERVKDLIARYEIGTVSRDEVVNEWNVRKELLRSWLHG